MRRTSCSVKPAPLAAGLAVRYAMDVKSGHHPTHTTSRRRKSGAGGVVALAAAAVVGAFLLGYVSRGGAPSAPAPVARQTEARPEPEPPVELPLLSDPVAPTPAPASSLPPSRLPSVPASEPSRPAPASAGKVPVVTAKAVKWARTHRVFAAFLKSPARMLAGKGARMSSPAALKAFLADREQVEAYLDSPLVRIALNSPVVSKALLSDPGVATAFLGSPAMRDPEAVKALMTSSLLKKILDCPGPQAALEDPKTLTSLVTNPATVNWLAKNPDGLKGLTAALPGVAEAFAPKLKKRK